MRGGLGRTGPVVVAPVAREDRPQSLRMAYLT